MFCLKKKCTYISFSPPAILHFMFPERKKGMTYLCTLSIKHRPLLLSNWPNVLSKYTIIPPPMFRFPEEACKVFVLTYQLQFRKAEVFQCRSTAHWRVSVKGRQPINSTLWVSSEGSGLFHNRAMCGWHVNRCICFGKALEQYLSNIRCMSTLHL